MNAGLPERLDKLLNAYSHHYDVQRDTEVEGGRFPASAEFYLRDENRLRPKSISIMPWSSMSMCIFSWLNTWT